jgi:hypothetical protein
LNRLEVSFFSAFYSKSGIRGLPVQVCGEDHSGVGFASLNIHCTWKVKAFELTLPGLTTVTVQFGEASPPALKAGSVSWLELLKVAVLFE